MKKISYLLISLLLLASCTQDLLENSIDKQKGEEVTAHFSLNTAPMQLIKWDKGVTTRSTDATTVAENQITDVWIVQFDNSGNFMKKEYCSRFDNTTFDAPLAVNATGTTSTIYFVANVGPSMTAPDNEAAFKTQVSSFATEADLLVTDPATSKKSIPMYGVLTAVTVPSTGYIDPLSVTLYHILAKVTVNYTIDSSSNFGLESIQLRNVPQSIQYFPPAAAANTATTSIAVRDMVAEATTATTGTLVYYIPENQRGIGTNTDAANNERLKDGTGVTNATYIEFKGHVTGKQAGDVVTFDLYLGADDYNNYNLVRNTKYEATVNITDCSLSDRRISVAERANCYMMRPGTTIEVPIMRANETDLGLQIADVSAAGAWTAALLWQTTIGMITVDNSTTTKGYFKVTAAAGKMGNAVVTAKNASGDVVWSWHIWVDDEDMNLVSNQQTLESFTMMNRNLGALTNNTGDTFASSTPLMYQWGRKDPSLGTTATAAPFNVYNAYNAAGTAFVPPTYTGITTVAATGDPYFLYANINQPSIGYNKALLTSVRYPALYLMSWRGSTFTTLGNVMSGSDSWGGEYNQPKSLYDPCPAGWRVPSCKKNSTSVVVPWPSVSYVAAATPAADGRYVVMYNSFGVFPACGYKPGSDASPFSSVGGLASGWSASNGAFDNGAGSAHDLWAGTATDFSEMDRTGRAAGQPIRCVKNWLKQ